MALCIALRHGTTKEVKKGTSILGTTFCAAPVAMPAVNRPYIISDMFACTVKDVNQVTIFSPPSLKSLGPINSPVCFAQGELYKIMMRAP